jgi:hypothetical protein
MRDPAGTTFCVVQNLRVVDQQSVVGQEQPNA